MGDLVNYRPEPAAVVDFVKASGSILVRGNHAHSIGYDEDPHCSPRFRKMADVTRRYTASVLNQDQKQFLKALPLHKELRRQNTRFYLCHATPSDPLYGYCPADSPDWIGEVQAVSADALLVGDTHAPFMCRKLQHKRCSSNRCVAQTLTMNSSRDARRFVRDFTEAESPLIASGLSASADKRTRCSAEVRYSGRETKYGLDWRRQHGPRSPGASSRLVGSQPPARPKL